MPRSVTLDGQEHGYVVCVPESLDLSRPVPLIVFLHGKGECGTDNQAQTRVGLPAAVRARPQRWPYLIVLPQKPNAEKQWEDYDAMVMAEVADVKARYRVDASRVYLTGLSQGGHGTWTLAANHPGEWAALAPVCGYGDPDTLAAKIKHLPVRAFHGGKDDVVKPSESEAMVKAINVAGGHAILTIYPEANHNSWDRAYQESDLAEWMPYVTRARNQAR